MWKQTLTEATPYDIKYPLLSSGCPKTYRKPEKSSQRKRERREKNLLEKLVEKFRNKSGKSSELGRRSHHLVTLISKYLCGKELEILCPEVENHPCSSPFDFNR